MYKRRYCNTEKMSKLGNQKKYFFNKYFETNLKIKASLDFFFIEKPYKL